MRFVLKVVGLRKFKYSRAYYHIVNNLWIILNTLQIMEEINSKKLYLNILKYLPLNLILWIKLERCFIMMDFSPKVTSYMSRDQKMIQAWLSQCFTINSNKKFKFSPIKMFFTDNTGESNKKEKCIIKINSRKEWKSTKKKSLKNKFKKSIT